MSDLHPTPTRLALLRAVDDARVWQQGQRTWLDLWRNVTARIDEVHAAGWVVLADKDAAGPYKRRWDLTDAGRTVLDTGGAR